MRAAIFEGPGNVRIEQVPDAEVELPTDALVRVTHAAICGADLWSYRGYGRHEPGSRVGQEFLGVVEAVGAEVRTLRVGDVVVAPHRFSDGTCEYCLARVQSSCVDGGAWGEPGNDGGLGEAVRVPTADGTLLVIPPALRSEPERVLPLAAVMATGEHGVRAAGVGFGMTVAVIGDGAVGLCAVLAAGRAGAARVIAVGHHEDRLDLAKRFGATETVSAQGDLAVEAVISLTGGVDATVECVGALASIETAIAVARDNTTVGYVGTPHTVSGTDLASLYTRNVAVRGGVCPSRAYIPTLMAQVASGGLDPSGIFDRQVDLDDVPAGYAAMDAREALKVLVTI